MSPAYPASHGAMNIAALAALGLLLFAALMPAQAEDPTLAAEVTSAAPPAPAAGTETGTHPASIMTANDDGIQTDSLTPAQLRLLKGKRLSEAQVASLPSGPGIGAQLPRGDDGLGVSSTGALDSDAAADPGTLGTASSSKIDTLEAANICPNLSPLTSIASNQLSSYPYNAVVRLVIRWWNAATRRISPSAFVCTGTALSNIVIVTSAHCVDTPPDANYPDRWAEVYYGWDGSRATNGMVTSKCISWWDRTKKTDNAIIILASAKNLARYPPYNYVPNVSPRTSVYMVQYGYAGGDEQACIGNRYGLLKSDIIAGNINLRRGIDIGRCASTYELWTSASQMKGQSGSCLFHSPDRSVNSHQCVGTASHDCEGTSCSTACPNAWAGFTSTYPLSSLWRSCGY